MLKIAITLLFVLQGALNEAVPTIEPTFKRSVSPNGVGNLIASPVRCDELRCFMLNGTGFGTRAVAFNASTGNILWNSPSSIFNILNLPVAAHGVVAFGSHYGTHVEVFDQISGKLLFSHQTTNGEFVVAGPNINSRGLILLTSNRTLMRNLTGALLWENSKIYGKPGTYNANRLAYDDSRIWVVMNTSLVALTVGTGAVDYTVPIVDNEGAQPRELTVQDNYAVSSLLVAWSTSQFGGDGFISSFEKKNGTRKWITGFTPSGAIYTSMISVSHKFNSFTMQEHDGQYSHISTTSYSVTSGKQKWKYGPYLGFNASSSAGNSQTIGPNYGGEAFVFSTLHNVLAVSGSDGLLLWKSPIVTAQNWANFATAKCPTTNTSFAVAPVSFNGVSVELASWQINNHEF